MIARILRATVVLELIVAAAVAHTLFRWRDWSLASAIAGGLAVPVILHAAVVALNFAIARFARGPAPVGSGIGVAGVLALFGREFLDSFVTFQVTQPWLAHHALAGEDRREWLDGDPLPVLLVHGYLCNHQVWRKTALHLARLGHTIGSLDLEPPWGPIDSYAQQITQAAGQLRARTGAPRIALVCHSMGGLAARAYLRAGGEHALATTAAVVTLGSPHRGTFQASMACGENGRQMRIGSEWLEDLASGETDSVLRRFTVILSHHDNIVASRERQSLPGAQTLEFSGIGHLSLLGVPRVLDAVERALADALRSGSPSSAAGTRSGQR